MLEGEKEREDEGKKNRNLKDRKINRRENIGGIFKGERIGDIECTVEDEEGSLLLQEEKETR